MPAHALLPVSFHDDTIFLVEHNDQPFAPMKPIVEGAGLTWPTQYKKLQSNRERWGVVEMTTPSKGGDQKTLCLPVRKLPAYFASIHPNKVRPELRAKIIQYQNECDDVLWNHWTEYAKPREAQALPAPEHDLPKEVRRAINSKAHTLSLRHYDRLREDLTEAVERHHARFPEDDDLVGYVRQVETPDGHLVVVHRNDLWRITAQVACMELMQKDAMEGIRALEAETGMSWYSR